MFGFRRNPASLFILSETVVVVICSGLLQQNVCLRLRVYDLSSSISPHAFQQHVAQTKNTTFAGVQQLFIMAIDCLKFQEMFQFKYKSRMAVSVAYMGFTDLASESMGAPAGTQEDCAP